MSIGRYIGTVAAKTAFGFVKDTAKIKELL